MTIPRLWLSELPVHIYHLCMDSRENKTARHTVVDVNDPCLYSYNYVYWMCSWLLQVNDTCVVYLSCAYCLKTSATHSSNSMLSQLQNSESSIRISLYWASSPTYCNSNNYSHKIKPTITVSVSGVHYTCVMSSSF